MRLGSWLLAALIILSLGGCSTKPSQTLDATRIIVVADEANRQAVRPYINGTFGRIVDTPQAEPLFQVSWAGLDKSADLTRSPLILLVGTLDGKGEASRKLKAMLTPDVANGVASGQYAIFSRKDAWAKGQLLLVLAAPNTPDLQARSRDWSDSLLNRASLAERERLRGKLLERGEDRAAEQQMRERSGIFLPLPHGFALVTQNDSLNFIQYASSNPERWITIAWGDMGEVRHLTPEFILARRKDIGGASLPPTVSYNDRWHSEETAVAGLPGYMIRGLWASANPIGGGPFITYALCNNRTSKYYIMDGAVYAPGDAKMPYLWQLDAIATGAVLPTE